MRWLLAYAFLEFYSYRLYHSYFFNVLVSPEIHKNKKIETFCKRQKFLLIKSTWIKLHLQ